jgi:lysophospholipase L1-like esterase
MNISTLIHTGIMGAFLLAGIQGMSQSASRSQQELIAASQGAASAMLFAPHATTSLIEAGKFYDDKECIVRNGLPHIMNLLQSGKPAKIAYIGGSITQGEYCYRQQSAKFITNQYSKSKITFLNAGVSGTGTDLGACRIGEQVLSQKPDLIFIEFAVNGAYAPGMEGMVRQVIKNNPQTDISLIYTIMTGQSGKYAEGSIPDNIKGLEAVADKYGLTSIHLGVQAAMLEKDNKLLWKGTKEEAAERILFSNDGIHPLPEGGNLYAAAIARAFIRLEKDKPIAVKKQLNDPLFTDKWEDAGMYSPMDIAQFNGQWEKIVPERGSDFYRYRPWFPYIMKSTVPGASFTFIFEGSAFGIFDIGGPEVGQIEIEVDGKPVKLTTVSAKGYHLYRPDENGKKTTINRFNSYCNNRYRGQYDLIEVGQGKHTITVKLSPEKGNKLKILGNNTSDIIANPAKYDQSVLYLGRILLRGKPAFTKN